MRSYRPISRVGERNAGLFFFAIERLPTGRANPLREPPILPVNRPLKILRGLAKVHFSMSVASRPSKEWPTRQG
jgi:hypothetical protein